MSDAAAFLEAIRAEPAADAPRLVYADWLDEQGGAADRDRAEFIRVQIALARGTDEDPRRTPLRQREAELLRLYEARWRAELPVLPGVTWVRFERGLMGAVLLHGQDGLGQVGALFAA